jgi:hypothetical protein
LISAQSFFILDARLLQQVGAVVEQAAVGGHRYGVELVAVLSGLDDRVEHLAGRELVGRQLVDPAVGGELGVPDDVEREDGVLVRLGLGVLDHLLALRVGVRGQLDEGDLLVRVLLVPDIEHVLHVAAGVLAGHVGDRTALGVLAVAGGGVVGIRGAAAGHGDRGEHRACRGCGLPDGGTRTMSCHRYRAFL